MLTQSNDRNPIEGDKNIGVGLYFLLSSVLEIDANGLILNWGHKSPQNQLKNVRGQHLQKNLSQIRLKNKQLLFPPSTIDAILKHSASKPLIKPLCVEIEDFSLFCAVNTVAIAGQKRFRLTFHTESDLGIIAADKQEAELKALKEDLNELIYLISHKLKSPAVSIHTLLDYYDDQADSVGNKQIIEMLKESTATLSEALTNSINRINARHNNNKNLAHQ